MINKIISFSIKNKFIIGLFTLALIGFGLYSMSKIPLGAVPDITNNQVQVITTSPNLSTSDIEQFVTYPVELSMANLPGVEEIRSISRFGLSVVTIVFEDEMGTYLPRQLVSEKLNEVREEIPEGFGSPAMGPISTGLGEIYQYFLEVDPEYDTVYNATELRTIQDWIIKRQMAMLPGVVEVNSFGGHIKQYEIALNPDRLKTMGLTIADVFEAIQQNNGNTGGAYIESNHKANFIRGEGLATSLDDLKNIVIKTVDGYPILVEDVATVAYGNAVRYGAFTKDGDGEAVGGIIMMLKDANPDEVVHRVKERMKQIQKSLPAGVHIQSFLDRSELIERTTHTISKNLIEGALIVIFVLVLLLGNFRGGLIVASVIPLSLLFAFILMRIFHIPANLMSLGAIDFGILVDGAVIIVEGVVHLMDKYILKQKDGLISKDKMDTLTYQSGSKMMNSAFFGQLIILIVFFPILTLTGEEGKMFRPMALTFSFAVLGAMILCLTYVPMVSALFLNRNTKKRRKKNGIEKLSHFILAKVEQVYNHMIHWALDKWKWVLGIAVLAFALAAFAFSQMGAVFIPSLDEGDFAMQAMLKPGSSLTETIQASNKAESILLENFPEINHVVARIGVSEIPTDPMPMDVADMFILMKPKKEWTSADSKEELIEKFKEKLSVFPGINFQFSQPVELRFNELATGIREDIAIKIYGEDLDVLAEKAQELAGMVQNIQGVGDLSVEATKGLPQLTIQYNRAKVAQYGLDIRALNNVIETSFAGKTAGQVFEGEKRFDIILRLNENYRNDIEDIKNLYVATPTGNQIPLKEVADISYQQGPMQISRDGTNRRIYVGINVRGRDVESLVHEIQEKLDQELTLPAGYYVTFGGEFENLQRAKNRLGLVVPIALILIFILLYFALHSLREAAMIYIAIPLATIGGVFSLYFRGLPFSISAGVGFVVLFGVAVLNGLVLINSLNELKEKGINDIRERIYQGTRQRLRPILLTATAAIMGFAPMALSTSAGAEVQRPLATVVIGGLITATLLTLIVIPVLYYLIEKRSKKKNMNKTKPILTTLIIGQLFIGLSLDAQNVSAQDKVEALEVSSVKQAIEIALENNPSMQIAVLTSKKHQQLEKTAFDLPKTIVSYKHEEFGHHLPGNKAFGVEQEFEFPTVYGKRSRLLKEESKLAYNQQEISKNRLTKEVRLAWYHLQNAYKQEQLYSRFDEIFLRMHDAAALQFKSGETNKLEMLSAEGHQKEIEFKKGRIQAEIEVYKEQLKSLLHTEDALIFSKLTDTKAKLSSKAWDEAHFEDNPMLQMQQQQIKIAESETALEKSQLLPTLNAGYALQKIDGQSGFQAFEIGIGIPLWFGAQKANIRATKTEIAIQKKQLEQEKITFNSQLKQWLTSYKQSISFLEYYESDGLKIAQEVIRSNDLALENGEIGYVEYIQNLDHAFELQENYLQALKEYNELVIHLNFLLAEEA